jgi:hypothetical protein
MKIRVTVRAAATVEPRQPTKDGHHTTATTRTAPLAAPLACTGPTRRRHAWRPRPVKMARGPSRSSLTARESACSSSGRIDSPSTGPRRVAPTACHPCLSISPRTDLLYDATTAPRSHTQPPVVLGVVKRTDAGLARDGRFERAAFGWDGLSLFVVVRRCRPLPPPKSAHSSGAARQLLISLVFRPFPCVCAHDPTDGQARSAPLRPAPNSAAARLRTPSANVGRPSSQARRDVRARPRRRDRAGRLRDAISRGNGHPWLGEVCRSHPSFLRAQHSPDLTSYPPLHPLLGPHIKLCRPP